MKSDLWIFFAIISGFMGFLLGYSTPPMIEIGFGGGSHGGGTTTIELQEGSSTDENLEDYYKNLQELQK